MSHRFECIAELRNGGLELPDEIVGRLRAKGIERVRVVLHSVAEDEESLTRRGITNELLERIASVQHLDRDIVTTVLSAEGAVSGSVMEERMRMLLGRIT